MGDTGRALSISTDAELLSQVVDRNPDKLVVLMFYLDSARACTAMDSTFIKMSNTFTSVTFLKVNPDQCTEARTRYDITHMPSILLFRNSRWLSTVRGAFPSILEKRIRENLTDQEGATTTGVAGAFDGPGGRGDLYRYMDLSVCDCYNVDGADPKFIEWFLAREDKLVSSVDPEVILEIGFNQSVKITSMTIKAPAATGPACMKLFINQVATVDFDAARSSIAAQVIILSASDLDGVTHIQIRQSIFRTVHNIYIYVPSNLGKNNITEIDYITLYGEPVNQCLGIAGVKNQVVFID